MEKKFIVITIIISIIVVCVSFWIFLGEDGSVSSVKIITEKKENEIVENNTEVKRTFKNDEVGIAFSYPATFREIKFQVSGGETGKSFSGVLESAQGHRILLGGVTKDYSAARGGSVMDNYGYEKIGDKYFIKFVWGNIEVIPSTFLGLVEGQAMVIQNTEIDQLMSSDMVTVLVNIPNSSFSGITFQTTSFNSGGLVSEEDIKVLREIVSSINFINNH